MTKKKHYAESPITIGLPIIVIIYTLGWAWWMIWGRFR